MKLIALLTLTAAAALLTSCEKLDSGYNWQSKPYTQGAGDTHTLTSSPGSGN